MLTARGSMELSDVVTDIAQALTAIDSAAFLLKLRHRWTAVVAFYLELRHSTRSRDYSPISQILYARR